MTSLSILDRVPEMEWVKEKTAQLLANLHEASDVLKHLIRWVRMHRCLYTY